MRCLHALVLDWPVKSPPKASINLKSALSPSVTNLDRCTATGRSASAHKMLDNQLLIVVRFLIVSRLCNMLRSHVHSGVCCTCMPDSQPH